MSEPVIVIDTFVSGALAPENHGGHRRVVFYSERPSPAGEAERIVVLRVVCTEAGFASIKAAFCQADGDGKAH